MLILSSFGSFLTIFQAKTLSTKLCQNIIIEHAWVEDISRKDWVQINKRMCKETFNVHVCVCIRFILNEFWHKKRCCRNDFYNWLNVPPQKKKIPTANDETYFVTFPASLIYKQKYFPLKC